MARSLTGIARKGHLCKGTELVQWRCLLATPGIPLTEWERRTITIGCVRQADSRASSESARSEWLARGIIGEVGKGGRKGGRSWKLEEEGVGEGHPLERKTKATKHPCRHCAERRHVMQDRHVISCRRLRTHRDSFSHSRLSTDA